MVRPASSIVTGQIKWCRTCRIRYRNGGPADPCLCCDGTLEVLPERTVKVAERRAELSQEAYWRAVLEPYANAF